MQLKKYDAQNAIAITVEITIYSEAGILFKKVSNALVCSDMY